MEQKFMSRQIIYRLANNMDSEKFKLLNDAFNGPNENSIENIKRYLGNIPSERVFVAEYKDDLVGFCCCQIINSVCYKTYSLEITELYVDKNYQKKGIGEGLMDFIEVYCNKNNIKKIELLTSQSNFNAQGFYEHLGYVKTNQVHYKKRIGESNND